MKHRSFNEYLIYVNQNDKYSNDLETFIDFFNDQQLVNVNKEVGIFFFNKNKIALAQQYLKKGIAKDKKDVQAVCVYVETYLSLGDLVTTEKIAQDYIAIYPTEARLYYFLGIAQQGLNNPKKAIKTLNEALDYLVDDEKLEANIYIQLGECYHKLGDEKQKEAFFIKASTILNK